MIAAHEFTGTKHGAGYCTAFCSCGWKSGFYTTRDVEGYRLAKRDVLDHVAHMEQGPNRYCTNSCPHVTGAGCGVAKDGKPCTPAYLCDPCVEKLLEVARLDDSVRTASEAVRKMGKAL